MPWGAVIMGSAPKAVVVAADAIHVSMGATMPSTGNEGDLFVKLERGSMSLYVWGSGRWTRIGSKFSSLSHSATGVLGFVRTKMGGGPMTLSGGRSHIDLVLMPGPELNTYEVRDISNIDGKSALTPWASPVTFPVPPSLRRYRHFPDASVTPDWT